MNCLKIKVKFTEAPSNIKVGFKNAITVSDGGYEKGYDEGYGKGYDIGYQEGYGVNADFLNTILNRDLDNEVYLEIPNGIKYLGINLFSNWYYAPRKGGLFGANLNEVKTVENGIFSGCKKLKSVNAPNLKNISYDMFYNCDSLQEAYFPNVETMNGGNGFRSCEALQKVVFDKLETMSNSDFNSCKILKDLIIRTPKVCVLSGKMSTHCTSFYDGTTTVYVPDELVEQYKVATNWVNHSDIIKPLSEYEGEI